MNVIFMGTPDFAVPCLEKLIEKHNVIAVFSQPDKPVGRKQILTPPAVKKCANEHKIDVFQPNSLKDNDIIKQIEDMNADIIVVVAYGKILPKRVLEAAKYGCINVHASLLPAYRGAAPIHRAILNGESRSGVTTMQMDKGMDTGDILLMDAVDIAPDMTLGELHDLLSVRGAALIVETLAQKFAGTLRPTPQDSSAASYAPMLDRGIERIDWTRPATQLHNQVRGLNPWPGAYYICDNITMKLWRSRVKPAAGPLVPGRIHSATAEGLVVETGQDLLELLEVQPECKRRMGAKECACGYCMTPGTILE